MKNYLNQEEIFFLYSLHVSKIKTNLNEYIELEEFYESKTLKKHLPFLLNMLLNSWLTKKINFVISNVSKQIGQIYNIKWDDGKEEWLSYNIWEETKTIPYSQCDNTNENRNGEIEYYCITKWTNINDIIFSKYNKCNKSDEKNEMHINLNIDIKILKRYLDSYFMKWDKNYCIGNFSYDVDNYYDVLNKYKSQWINNPDFLKYYNDWNNSRRNDRHAIIDELDDNKKFLEWLRDKRSKIYQNLEKNENMNFTIEISHLFKKWESEANFNYYLGNNFIMPLLQIKKFMSILQKLNIEKWDTFIYEYIWSSEIDEYSLILYFLVNDYIEISIWWHFPNEKKFNIKITENLKKVFEKYKITNPYTGTMNLGNDIDYKPEFKSILYKGTLIQLWNNNSNDKFIIILLENLWEWIWIEKIRDKLWIDNHEVQDKIHNIYKSLNNGGATNGKKILFKHINHTHMNQYKISFI
jgi:hypothetical protein